MTKLTVAVRVRPLSDREISARAETIVSLESDNIIAVTNKKVPEQNAGDSRKRVRRFTFDYCFDSDSTQENVYAGIGSEISETIRQRFHCSVLAYGQSASGKTHTMIGNGTDEIGLAPRICQDLFDRLAENAVGSELENLTASVSYLEIYNEKVRDLLDKGSNKCAALRVREHPKRGPYVQGLSERKVSSSEHLLECLRAGNSNRTEAATAVNPKSSRSHSVFTVTCHSGGTDVKLRLVDLAGSERAGCRERAAPLFREGANINRSLVALRNVIAALAESSRSSRIRKRFIPYRDSTLTWLLKDTLGGNSKTILISTVSPSSTCYNETVNTLRFGQIAKRIILSAEIEEDPKERTIRELRAEVARLRDLLKLTQLLNDRCGTDEEKIALLKVQRILNSREEATDVDVVCESNKQSEEVNCNEFANNDNLERVNQVECEIEDKQINEDTDLKLNKSAEIDKRAKRVEELVLKGKINNVTDSVNALVEGEVKEVFYGDRIEVLSGAEEIKQEKQIGNRAQESEALEIIDEDKAPSRNGIDDVEPIVKIQQSTVKVEEEIDDLATKVFENKNYISVVNERISEENLILVAAHEEFGKENEERNDSSNFESEPEYKYKDEEVNPILNRIENIEESRNQNGNLNTDTSTLLKKVAQKLQNCKTLKCNQREEVKLKNKVQNIKVSRNQSHVWNLRNDVKLKNNLTKNESLNKLHLQNGINLKRNSTQTFEKKYFDANFKISVNENKSTRNIKEIRNINGIRKSNGTTVEEQTQELKNKKVQNVKDITTRSYREEIKLNKNIPALEISTRSSLKIKQNISTLKETKSIVEICQGRKSFHPKIKDVNAVPAKKQTHKSENLKLKVKNHAFQINARNLQDEDLKNCVLPKIEKTFNKASSSLKTKKTVKEIKLIEDKVQKNSAKESVKSNTIGGQIKVKNKNIQNKKGVKDRNQEEIKQKINLSTKFQKKSSDAKDSMKINRSVSSAKLIRPIGVIKVTLKERLIGIKNISEDHQHKIKTDLKFETNSNETNRKVKSLSEAKSMRCKEIKSKEDIKNNLKVKSALVSIAKSVPIKENSKVSRQGVKVNALKNTPLKLPEKILISENTGKTLKKREIFSIEKSRNTRNPICKARLTNSHELTLRTISNSNGIKLEENFQNIIKRRSKIREERLTKKSFVDQKTEKFNESYAKSSTHESHNKKIKRKISEELNVLSVKRAKFDSDESSQCGFDFGRNLINISSELIREDSINKFYCQDVGENFAQSKNQVTSLHLRNSPLNILQSTELIPIMEVNATKTKPKAPLKKTFSVDQSSDSSQSRKSSIASLKKPEKAEKSVATDGKEVKSKVDTHRKIAKPRSQIVAAVTQRLYNKVKKKEAATDTDDIDKVESPKELEICSNARNRLRLMTLRALKAHRRKHVESQTDRIVLRVKEVSTDVFDLKMDSQELKDAEVNTEIFTADIGINCILDGRLHVSRSCGTSTEDKISFRKYLEEPRTLHLKLDNPENGHPIYTSSVNINVHHNYINNSKPSGEFSDDSLEDVPQLPTPDLLSNHNSLEKQIRFANLQRLPDLYESINFFESPKLKFDNAQCTLTPAYLTTPVILTEPFYRSFNTINTFPAHDSLPYHHNNQRKVHFETENNVSDAMGNFLKEANTLMLNLNSFAQRLTEEELRIEVNCSFPASKRKKSRAKHKIRDETLINKYESVVENSCARLEKLLDEREHVIVGNNEFSSLESQPAHSDYGSLPRSRKNRDHFSPSSYLKQLATLRREIVEASREELFNEASRDEH